MTGVEISVIIPVKNAESTIDRTLRSVFGSTVPPGEVLVIDDGCTDGTIEIVYGGITATDGLTGVTEGGGAADPDPTDLSAAGSLSATGTTYELFDGLNPADLSFLTLLFL